MTALAARDPAALEARRRDQLKPADNHTTNGETTMKTIATIVLSLLLGGTVLVTPAAAEEAAAPTCDQYLAESQYREGVLHDQISGLKQAAVIIDRDYRQLERKVERQRATIKRLRAQLASR